MFITKDKMGGIPTNHSKSVQKIKEICSNLDLIDIWRDLYPEERRFTRRRRKPEVHCRLEFFLISQEITTNVSNVDILPGYMTDHSMIAGRFCHFK